MTVTVPPSATVPPPLTAAARRGVGTDADLILVWAQVAIDDKQRIADRILPNGNEHQAGGNLTGGVCLRDGESSWAGVHGAGPRLLNVPLPFDVATA